nr:hypothetical protein Iba_chr01aCG7910 [Ipomoea batatas]
MLERNGAGVASNTEYLSHNYDGNKNKECRPPDIVESTLPLVVNLASQSSDSLEVTTDIEFKRSSTGILLSIGDNCGESNFASESATTSVVDGFTNDAYPLLPEFQNFRSKTLGIQELAMPLPDYTGVVSWYQQVLKQKSAEHTQISQGPCLPLIPITGHDEYAEFLFTPIAQSQPRDSPMDNEDHSNTDSPQQIHTQLDNTNTVNQDVSHEP